MASEKQKILVIGSGPAQLGDDGTEDAAVTDALRILRERGLETVLLSANPATLASDAIRADRTYLEPLDDLALRAVVAAERPALVLADLGGPAAIALARALEADGSLAAGGASLISANSIGVLRSPAPERAATTTKTSARARVLVVGPGPSRIGEGSELVTCTLEVVIAAREAGYSAYVAETDAMPDAATALAEVLALGQAVGATQVIVQTGGGRATAFAAELVAGGLTLLGTQPADLARAASASSTHAGLSLDDAIAVSVDAVSDGTRVVIAGLLEHLEPPFVHAGDAAAILPAHTLDPEIALRIEDRVRALALELRIIGLVEVHLAVIGSEIVVLDVAPRAALTTSFVARATGFPLVNVATKVMLGQSLDAQGVQQPALPRHVAARERVFPRERDGGDPMLGSAMGSTGEAIGIDDTPARAYAKALRGVGISVAAMRAESPAGKRAPAVLFAVTERDHPSAVELARRFRALGFTILATGETASAITKARIPVASASSPDQIRAGDVDCAIVTARGDSEIASTRSLRSACLASRVPCFTTIRLARLGCAALEEAPAARVRTLQAWYADA